MNIKERAAKYSAAWCAGDAEAVGELFTPDAVFIINRGDPCEGREAIKEMARGFFHDVPDLVLKTELLRVAGAHVLHAWTFTGHHFETRNPLSVGGWEEWECAPDGRVERSFGWYDADDYARQIAGA